MDPIQYCYDFFIKGGPVMWPLLICSIVALTVAVERLIYMWRVDLSTNEELLQTVFRAAGAGDYNKAIEVGENASDSSVRVIAYGLQHRDHGLSETMQVEAERHIDKMKRGMSVLDTIITMAPLLGILGTVTGIIKSFNLLSDSGMPDPRIATSGLAEALITTVAGLVIALATLVPFNYLTSKIQRIARRLEHIVTEFEVVYRKSQGRDS